MTVALQKVLAFLLIIVLCAAPCLASQKGFDKRGRFEFYIVLDAAGSIQPTFVPSTVGSLHCWDLETLEDPEIQNELDLSIEFSPWIKRIRRQIKPQEDHLREGIAIALQRNNMAEADKLLRAIEPIHRDVEQILQEQISDATWQRQRQLQFRHLLVNGGILLALEDPGVQDALALDERVSSKWEERIPVLREEVQMATNALVAQTTHKTLAVLDERQRQILNRLSQTLDQIAVPSLELAMWQARYAQYDHAEYADALEELRDTTAFTITPSGSLKASPSGKLVVNDLKAMFLEDEQLGLLDFQIEEYEKKVADPSRSAKIKEDIAKLLIQREAGQIDYTQLMEKVQQRAMDDERHRWQLFKSVLFPFQEPRVEALLIHRTVMQRGLMAALTNGRLAVLLEVSTEQRQQIRDLAAASVVSLYERSIELEKHVWDELFKDLAVNQRTRMKTLIGKAPTRMAGAPGLLLMPRPDNLQLFHQFLRD